MDIYVARQPIFDKNKKIFGYELLFRDSMANFMPDIDGDIASSKVLSSSFYTIGLDTITGGKKAFINFTENLLLQKFPLMFPNDCTVVEILEDVEPNEDLIQSCKEIAQKGYTVALDDFVYSAELKPLISLAHIIKFDFMASSFDEIKTYMADLPSGLRFLAEKVETYDEFKTGLEMGFELFQGYFFCKPEVIQGKEVSGSKLNLLQIMTETNKKDFELNEVETLMSRDVAISYKLLRYINSAYFGKKEKVSSIKEALLFMGVDEIKRFVSLMAMSKLASGKPDELVRISCVRAKFCELVGALGKADPLELFTLGLFSLIDAILDRPMKSIMDNLPLFQSIKDALIKNKGTFACYLDLIKKYEKGEWPGVKRIASQLDIDETQLPELYLKACSWVNMLAP